MKSAFRASPKSASSETPEGLPAPYSSSLEADAAPDAPIISTQPVLNTGGGERVAPINSSLLEPLDTTAAEAIRVESVAPKHQDEASSIQAMNVSTPAQIKQRRLETAPSILCTEEKRRRKHRSKASPNAGSLRGDDEASTDDASATRRTRRVRKAIMKSGGSGSSRMHGQDSLEVRSVRLANGQKASLILEEGRLQRIVAANGQVAELNWSPPTLNRVAGSRKNLSVRLHQGISPVGAKGNDRSMPTAQSTIRRWANSLNSQRLTTGPSAAFPKDQLNTGASSSGLNSREMQTIQSVDMHTKRSAPKSRSFMQGLLSLPSHAKATSQADMPSILETTREVNKDWNPIHESWLPSTMTTQFLQGDPSKPIRSNGDQEAFSGVATGRSVGHKKQQTQSLDARLGTGRRDEFPMPEGIHTRASISGGDAYRLSGGAYDSDPGFSGEDSRMRSFWRSLKRILHLPTVMKVRSPRAPRTNNQGHKKASFAKRFSMGKRGGASKSASEGVSFLPDHNDATYGKRMRSTTALPDATPASTSPGSSHLRSSHPRDGDLSVGLQQLASRFKASEVTVPVTPQQIGPKRAPRATAPTSADANEANLTSSEAATPAAAHGFSGRGAGELIDTTELRAALAQRKSVREAQLAVGEDGSDKAALRSRRRRHLDLDKPSTGKPRTMMAGRWQKNFTEGTSGNKVDELLQVSSLQRLARERIVEMEIVETEESFEMVWHIPLNGSSSKISKTDRYLKNGEVVEAARRDGRPGVLRSQLTFTPEGHVHIRALQGEPFSAVFHDRIKLSTGGRRIKIEQKFQLLQPGVLPVKHFSIWNRVE